MGMGSGGVSAVSLFAPTAAPGGDNTLSVASIAESALVVLTDRSSETGGLAVLEEEEEVEPALGRRTRTGLMSALASLLADFLPVEPEDARALVTTFAGMALRVARADDGLAAATFLRLSFALAVTDFVARRLLAILRAGLRAALRARCALFFRTRM